MNNTANHIINKCINETLENKRFYYEKFGWGTVIREGIHDFSVVFDINPYKIETFYKKKWY